MSQKHWEIGMHRKLLNELHPVITARRLNAPSAISIAALVACMALASCGGGGSSDSNGSTGGTTSTPTPQTSSSTILSQAPNAPQFVSNTATDGLDWFNYRRQQSGLATVSRNAKVDAAAQAHSTYQKLNNTISHEEVSTNAGFTGTTLQDRLTAAGFSFTTSRFAYGEVISATGDPSGFVAAEDLVGAIYHRFVILEPMFTQAGAGTASVTDGYTYFTTDFVANGLGPGLGRGNFAVYPPANQTSVPTNFFTDRETPDPVASQNEVGYPISVHADITAIVLTQSFTVQARGGAPLSVQKLTNATDTNTPRSAAAIIPLSVLSPKTTYDVHFAGTVDGVAASRDWSFTTQ
ncbi:MAG: hypothetical protein JWR22_225 [Herminiimonas sp.]|nr:hypothetical protein [Herminiimonas sp.]